jgi:hypothetical protein
MRMLVNAVGEEPALIEADIAGRRANEPRHGVAASRPAAMCGSLSSPTRPATASSVSNIRTVR